MRLVYATEPDESYSTSRAAVRDDLTEGKLHGNNHDSE